jgi:hypothetical protein
MVRRICLTPRKTEGDDEQRHNLFHSTCTCEKVVAEEAVQKLALDIEKHPTPYRLELLKKGNEVIVSKRWLVHFSIGTKYKDNT